VINIKDLIQDGYSIADTALIHRIVRKRFAASPFDGEGSYRFGGRWSRPGTRVAYASEHLSLALLEYLANLDPSDTPNDLVVARAEVPAHLSRLEIKVPELPLDWTKFPAPNALADIGDAFIRAATAVLLIVPSALVPGERNFLLNPAHPEYSEITLRAPEPITLDYRLVPVGWGASAEVS
jgi:RES domain-containing protein